MTLPIISLLVLHCKNSYWFNHIFYHHGRHESPDMIECSKLFILLNIFYLMSTFVSQNYMEVKFSYSGVVYKEILQSVLSSSHNGTL